MSKKVIVVDDSRTARQQVRSALQTSGYEIVEAIDGLDGIVKIDANRDASLVLCDLTARTLRQGLNLLGIEVVEQM